MNIDELYSIVTPEIYERFKTAVELGKWPNGVQLTKAQKQICLQAIIAYDNKYLKEEERIGFLPKKEDEITKRSHVEKLKWQDKSDNTQS